MKSQVSGNFTNPGDLLQTVINLLVAYIWEDRFWGRGPRLNLVFFENRQCLGQERDIYRNIRFRPDGPDPLQIIDGSQDIVWFQRLKLKTGFSPSIRF